MGAFGADVRRHGGRGLQALADSAGRVGRVAARAGRYAASQIPGAIVGGTAAGLGAYYGTRSAPPAAAPTQPVHVAPTPPVHVVPTPPYVAPAPAHVVPTQPVYVAPRPAHKAPIYIPMPTRRGSSYVTYNPYYPTQYYYD